MTDLEKALQATVERLVESRLAALRQELAKELQEEISAALARVPAGEAVLAASSAGFATLNQSIGRILQPSVQAEIMGAALQGAAGFAGRCALFAKKGDVFALWRGEGFQPDQAKSLRSVIVPATQPGIFKDLCDTHDALSRPRSPDTIPATLDQALGASADPSIYLFPVVVQGKVVAALYADAGSKAGSVDPAALEILARITSLSLETAASRAALLATPPAASAVAPSASETPPTAVPEPPAHAPEPAAAPSSPPPGSFAASIPAAPEAPSSLAPPPDPDSLPEDERDAHKRAHRFARVAVQDLLSYHKAKIEQGRQNKNLYQVMKDDIDKTRENYKQRFGQTPASSFDYLYYELVLRLAGNDPAALGSQYPGSL